MFSDAVNLQFNSARTWAVVAVEYIKTIKLAAVNDEER